MKRSVFALAAAPALLLGASQAMAVTTQPVLEDQDVATVVKAAEDAMAQHNVKGCVAVANSDGQIIFFERQQGAYASCDASAIAKARTSALFHAKSDDFMNMLNKDGATNLLGVPDLAPMPGGMPLALNDQDLGGVGVSTPDGNIDTPVAEAAAAALGAK
ncbi:heme-binding protein [Pseudooceanicola sp. CBS1P-1]|uniref:Heme-binding protein n=1 Tax=Pseudooceanicola albus TaxID=2692189 RepID=A0A6L7G095_9RHOB|nr:MULTISPECIES: heme-binding protein [Pseudooceanicola]MBT9382254.1 heme-binding protein [Pseudooceanicola endophyticus]MXN16797.1 heme-binding protein [Pseudooceanicola albus]